MLHVLSWIPREEASKNQRWRNPMAIYGLFSFFFITKKERKKERKKEKKERKKERKKEKEKKRKTETEARMSLFFMRKKVTRAVFPSGVLMVIKEI